MAVAGLLLYKQTGRERAVSITIPAAQYVGQNACAACHQTEAEQWRGSDHALAMQVVNDQTVLGDFNEAQFIYAGVTSTFYKRDGKFFARTDGPDGKLHDYEIAHVFGVRPLQQYLIAFPNGRLQALSIAWDARPAREGGQRWFHLYPDEKIKHDDPLHWTGRNQNWNYMCAECHSTNLQKNYDLVKDSYATTWSELNVSCEACHGPGSAHVTWAEAWKAGNKSAEDQTKGLLVNFRGAGNGNWEISDAAKGTAHWTGAPRLPVEVETCAPCHARRRPIISPSEPGRTFLDRYVPTLLDNGLYHADGQILDEVYEYGSFTQSKMYRAGVTCSDCHNPHSVKLLRTPLNTTCTKCHQAEKFDTAEHHRHQPATEAALCVNCHMPTKTYMGVDVRRDHSFRVPRPDLSVSYGTPNACTQCHKDKAAQWAADAVARWYGPNRRQEAHYGAAIDAGRRGLPEAEKGLIALANDRQMSAIVRATALSLLPDYPAQASLFSVQNGLKDEEALVRTAALRALELMQPEGRWPLVADLLRDPVRSVRIEAARGLAGTPPESLSAQQREDLKRAIAELVAAEMTTAERPDAHLNLSLLHVRTGRLDEAEQSLKTALRLEPRFVPGLINLADLYRSLNRDGEGEQLLRQAMALAPDSAQAVYSLGLLLVRRGQRKDALDYFRQAASLQPGVARYGYAYGLALHESGDLVGALRTLEQTHQRHPLDRETLIALLTFERDRGNLPSALRYAEKLVALAPQDQEARATLEQLRRMSRAVP
ncbi:MAG: tetratricopeptide repeat protein [Acidobacteria bacterium]|nr:tetratricopeptide repeat protein [Acidobacteriota bacterium]